MATTHGLAQTARQLPDLPRLLEQHDGFAGAARALRQGKPASFDGAWDAGRALLLASLARHARGPLIAICPQLNDVDLVSDDLRLFTDAPVLTLPAWESDPGERTVDDEIYGDRLRTLKRLLAYDQPPSPDNDWIPATDDESGEDWTPDSSGCPIVVTSIQSLLQPVPARGQLQDATRRIVVGQTLELDYLLRWLAGNGFHGTSAVEMPGEFSSRGGILDVFAPDWERPVRIELFDEEVESIRWFDVASQRSHGTCSEIEITLLGTQLDEQAQLAEYLPESAWIVLFDLAQLDREGRAYLERQEDVGAYHTVANVLKSFQPFSTATAAALDEGATGAVCHLGIESVERFSGEIGRVRDELQRIGRGHDVIVVASTEAEVERLSELLGSTTLAASGRLQYQVGSLSGGFRLVPQQLIVVTASELFHRGELRRLPRRRQGKPIDSFLDLREGDLVVHLAHGIGRYRGLRLLDKNGQVEEHLELEFHGRTKVFVPAAKIGLVQKYVGAAKSRPQLARIGGQTWVRQKKAAEAAVMDMAADLLELQATRQSRTGLAFPEDSQWQREFDASFPYEETPDQLAAIEAVKEDMQRRRPTDRLLCGDVGFGKTEIAMRAAFKAVDAGYQVAVLVPTTILAEQHYRTFQQRMAEFPFDIARLSRFCTAAEQRDIIARLKKGQIDIVIGTHRLASKDVSFLNLGLVIIDEEQRFGVEVKERLKSLRSTVDIMTLSATPIPRTLHMSLVGLRDISNLETAPADRFSVETRVTRWNDELIRHAVLRELSRGGQIFFVHNRVGDIHALEKRLKYIVPEATIRIGHGQMPEQELEQVMLDFVAGKFDLLLATTIVESGLDIPNANTIFIDEAHRYGLADLHQLRGRVGRYKHRAYCYLLVDRHKHITPNAAKRLRAIEEYSEMGAGFAIAMRDLEIRGAGNLLGTQQSGHIAAVGYELYCQLLDDAVRRLKKMPPRVSIDVDIDLPVTAFLPDDYVPDMRLKIDFYRRLMQAASFDQIDQLRAEAIDRFGQLPPPAQQLFEIGQLRLFAAQWQIAAIRMEDRFLVFDYTDRQRIEYLKKICGRTLRIVDVQSAYLPLEAEERRGDALLNVAKSVLQG